MELAAKWLTVNKTFFSTQLGEHFLHGGFRGEAVLFAEDGGGAVL